LFSFQLLKFTYLHDVSTINQRYATEMTQRQTRNESLMTECFLMRRLFITVSLY